jgi:hypothetical protein
MALTGELDFIYSQRFCIYTYICDVGKCGWVYSLNLRTYTMLEGTKQNNLLIVAETAPLISSLYSPIFPNEMSKWEELHVFNFA